MNTTPSGVWSGIHSPTIVTVPRSDGATDVMLHFDGGYYNQDDATRSVFLWARELDAAGLTASIHPDILQAHPEHAEWLQVALELNKAMATPEQPTEPPATAPRPRTPLAKAITARRNRDNPEWFVIEIICPYCPDVHTHGWAGPGDDGGHRAPHCADGWREQSKRGYSIVIPYGFKVPR